MTEPIQCGEPFVPALVVLPMRESDGAILAVESGRVVLHRATPADLARAGYVPAEGVVTEQAATVAYERLEAERDEAEAERDAAIARAEAAERERDEARRQGRHLSEDVWRYLNDRDRLRAEFDRTRAVVEALPRECDACSAKPGSPVLCALCLAVRNAKSTLAAAPDPSTTHIEAVAREVRGRETAEEAWRRGAEAMAEKVDRYVGCSLDVPPYQPPAKEGT